MQVYAYGMVIALAAGFIWQAWASYVGYNVSATHSISEWLCVIPARNTVLTTP
jgi:phosphate/sulfate permease